MKKTSILFLLLCNIAYGQISQNKESQQMYGNDFNLQNKNEIIFSGYLPKNRGLKYITRLNESPKTGNGIDSLEKVKIPTKHSILAYISLKQMPFSFVFIEIFPGEDIQLVLDQKGELKLSSNNNITRSTDLSFYYNNPLFSSYYDFSLLLIKNKTTTQIIEYVDSVELARVNMLKEFVSNHKVSDRFYPMVFQQIKNKKNYSLTKLLLSIKETNSKKLLPIIEKLKNFYCKNDTFSSIEHGMGAYEFCRFLTIKELKLKDIPENMFNTANKYYKGMTLDATLFTITKQTMNVNTSSTRKLLNVFYSRCKDPDFIDNIRSEEVKYNFAADKGIIDGLIMLDKSKSSWAQQLAKYKGKVIYVDFWASWCGPCINEIPYIEELKKQYAKKGVVFISISTDKQFSDWKSKVDQLKIDSPYSFLIANSANSPLMKSLEIKLIPRFVLIDKAGKIVSKDAIRPSDKNIHALIDQYL